MSGPLSKLPPVVVVLGPGADVTVVDHTLRMLNDYGISFTQFNWPNFEDVLTGGATEGLEVIVFATGVAYTDEHLRLPEDVNVPVVRFITDVAVPPGQKPTNTPLIATIPEAGVSGAVNAGIFAARVVARNNPTVRDMLTNNPSPDP